MSLHSVDRSAFTPSSASIAYPLDPAGSRGVPSDKCAVPAEADAQDQGSASSAWDAGWGGACSGAVGYGGAAGWGGGAAWGIPDYGGDVTWGIPDYGGGVTWGGAGHGGSVSWGAPGHGGSVNWGGPGYGGSVGWGGRGAGFHW